MSISYKITTQKVTGITGFQIKAVVYNPYPQLFDGKKQLVKNQFVPLTDCPGSRAAKKLAQDWENELYETAHSKKRSVLLSNCLEVFIEKSKNRQEKNVAKFLIKEIGNLPVALNLKDDLNDWADIQRLRKKLIRQKGEVFCFVESKKIIAESTVRGYLRLPKTSINKYMAKYPGVILKNPLDKMKIGRNLARKRPVTDLEKAVIEKTIQEICPYFMFSFEFASMNMCRPQDQFSLSITRHVERDPFNNTWKIEYEPKKTINQVLEPVFAHPVVFDKLDPYFENLHSPEECDNLFVRPGLRRLREDASKLYPITQAHADGLWERIIKKASLELSSVSDITWYDWRHYAVGWLLQHGFKEVQIMDIAGWTSPEMIWRYYPRNRTLYVESKAQMREALKKEAKSKFVSKNTLAA
jgi:hypothetical protein